MGCTPEPAATDAFWAQGLGQLKKWGEKQLVLLGQDPRTGLGTVWVNMHGTGELGSLCVPQDPAPYRCPSVRRCDAPRPCWSGDAPH